MNINHYKKIYRDIKKYILGTNEFSFIENYQEKFLYPINLDFTLEEKEFYYCPMDENGIPYKIYSSVGKQYNPTRIAAYGLSHYNDYMLRNNENSKEIFLKCLDWFFSNKEGRYEYNFDWNDLKAPWISCMAQGEAISVLLRGYYLTKDEKYLQKAKQVSAPFHHEINSNGVLSKIDNHFLFLEEYPSIKQQYVLNGFLYSFIGLSEYNLIVKDDEKNRNLYNELINTIKNKILLWGPKYWSYYEIPQNINKVNCCTPSYHNLQITQLKYFYSKYPNPNINKTIINWEKGLNSFFIRMQSFFCKLIYRIRNKTQR